MRKLSVVLLIAFLVALGTSCGRDTVTAPPTDPVSAAASDLVVDPDRLASEILLATGWELDPSVEVPAELELLRNKGLPAALLSFERTEVIDDIVHYEFEIPVGDGPYETIQLHRVVREPRPYRPIRAKENLYCLHGSPGTFEMMFLFGAVAPNVPDDLALAVYLAQRDVDVWGVDRPCNSVPMGVEDFSFMADWDLQFNVDAVRAGAAVARVARLLSGCGGAPVNLLGYSTGLAVGYATVNHEAGLPLWARQIGGFVPVDNKYKYPDGPDRDWACAAWELETGMLESGIYASDYGVLFNTISLLAASDPGGDSPIMPGFTNRDTAVIIAAMTWLIFDPPKDPPIHFFGGVFDEVTGLATDLAYSEYSHFLDFLMLPAPYEEMAFDIDIQAVGCEAIDVPYDDHLGEITIPILYVGAAGGMAPEDPYMLSLLGSDDIMSLTVGLLPPEAAVMDVGHVDLFTAEVSVDLFWAPLADWVATHSGGAWHGHREINETGGD